MQRWTILSWNNQIFQKKVISFINMFRVLLKIDKVSIKIKEAVGIIIVIKKNHDYFAHCKNQILLNGQLELANSSEFFISKQNPTFIVEVILLHGQVKKKGGSHQLNLNNFQINTSHRKNAVLEHSPLQNSTLLIDFTYMDSEQPLSKHLLISLKQMEQGKHKEELLKLGQFTQGLSNQNEKLSQEIEKLREKNKTLFESNKVMEVEKNKKEEEYKKQFQKMQEQKQYTYHTLVEQKKKIAQIVEIINLTGDPELINMMGDLISKHEI